MTVDLSTGNGSGGTAAGDTFDSIENVIGSSHDDVRRHRRHNLLNGQDGNDTLKVAAATIRKRRHRHDVVKGGSADLCWRIGGDTLIGNEDDDF